MIKDRLAALKQYIPDMDSVAMKMFRIFFAFTVAGTLLFTVINIYYQTTRANSELSIKGRILASLLADSIKVPVFAENAAMLDEAVSGIMKQSDVMGVYVYAASDRQLYSKVKKGAMIPGSTSLRLKGDEAKEPRYERKGNGILEFGEPVTLESGRQSEESIFFDMSSKQPARSRIIGRVVILFDTSQLVARQISIVIESLLVALVLLAAGAVLIFYVLDRAMKPLAQLTEEVRLFGEGKDYPDLPAVTKDEVGRLSAAFSEMILNLKRREKEKQDLEQRLRTNQKMEVIGTLSRGIAHDFNNILTSLEGSLYAIKKQVDPADPLQSFVFHMGNSVARARVVIESLMLFSRGQVTRRLPVELNAIIENLMPAVESMAGREVHCILRLHEQPLVISGDPFQIEQTVMNLIVNARDAMPGGGTITVGTYIEKVPDYTEAEGGPRRPGNYAMLYIKDTGEGMDEETRQKIFDPFFTTKDVGKGTGLGLSIVYGIVQDYDGFIDVLTQKGGGTEVRIYLPIIEKS